MLLAWAFEFAALLFRYLIVLPTQAIGMAAFHVANKYAYEWYAPAAAVAGVNAAALLSDAVLNNPGTAFLVVVVLGAFFGALLLVWLVGNSKVGFWGAILVPSVNFAAVGMAGPVFGTMIFDLVAAAAIFYVMSNRMTNRTALGVQGATGQQGSSGQQGGLPAGVEFIPRQKPDPNAFSNIVGLDEAKQAIWDALGLPMTQPELIEAYKITPPRGILLYGPPGTGKTSFARAVAGYFGCSFYVVNASSLAGGIVGQTEANIRGLFTHARQHRPAVIFFDEIDAIGRKREGQHLNRPSDLALNVLLAELDGFKQVEGVICIAATNRLDVLDAALLRPGRFDRKIEIGLPDPAARKEMLMRFLAGRPCAVTEAEIDDLVRETGGVSPAELREAVDRAALEAAKAGENISYFALFAALKKTMETAEKETKPEERERAFWLPG